MPQRSLLYLAALQEMEERHCSFLSCIGVSDAFCCAEAAAPSTPNPLLADPKKVSAEAPGLRRSG